jgi:hypothetical protein
MDFADMRGWLLRRFHRDRHERELDDELRFHVETHTRDLIAQGVPPVEARRRALASFGGIEPIKMMTRDVGRGRWFPDLAQDLRYAARTLKRQPGFATVAVLTLTLGIGATTAIFSVVEAIFLRPLPVPHPEQLVLFTGDTFQGTHSSTPPPEGIWTLFSSDAYDFLRAEPLPFASVAAFTSGRDTVTARVVGDVNGRATPTGTRASAQLVSGSYFDVIGVRATQGRTLSPDDDRPEAPPVAVLSDAFWRNSLHAEQDVIGRVITLNRTAFAVVGVMCGCPSPASQKSSCGSPTGSGLTTTGSASLADCRRDGPARARKPR